MSSRNKSNRFSDTSEDKGFLKILVLVLFSVALCNSCTFESVASSLDSVCGVCSNGTVLCWGEEIYYQNVPSVPIVAASLTSSYSFYCGITPDFYGYCWGYKGNDSNYQPPSDVQFTEIVSSSVDYYLCGIRKNDSLMQCWGDRPVNLVDDPIIALDIGSLYFCATYPDYSIYCQYSPPSVSSGGGLYRISDGVPDGNDFVQISVGYTHACALQSNGSVSCWGSGGDYVSATVVPVGIVFAAVEVGFGFTCAIENSTRYVACWGVLGDLQTPPPYTPVAVVTCQKVIPDYCVMYMDGSMDCFGSIYNFTNPYPHTSTTTGVTTTEYSGMTITTTDTTTAGGTGMQVTTQLPTSTVITSSTITSTTGTGFISTMSSITGTTTIEITTGTTIGNETETMTTTSNFTESVSSSKKVVSTLANISIFVGYFMFILLV